MSKVSDNVGVTFINGVVGSGVLNGVVNVQLGVCQFGIDDKMIVDGELSVVSRLRMDLMCAKQLYETIGKILEAVEQGQKDGAEINGVVSGLAPSDKKPN